MTPRNAVAAPAPQNKSAPEKPTSGRDNQLTQWQIQEIEQERSRTEMRLENAKQALAKREDQLAAVLAAEQTANEFLQLSNDSEGWHSKRLRAEETLAHCRTRRAELEPLIENRRREVAQLQGELAKIGKPAAQRLQQEERLRVLGQKLSSPLP